MKNVKILLLLGVMLVNVMPYLKDGKVEWKTTQAEAQYYTIEDYGDGWFQCGDHSDPAVNFDYYGRCELLNLIPPPPMNVPVCYSIENRLAFAGAVRGYNGNTFGGNMCGLLVLASITGFAPELLKLCYCSTFLNPPIPIEDFTSTHNEKDFYEFFGVTIGDYVRKTKCELLTDLHNAGRIYGVFAENLEHVYVWYEISYDQPTDNGHAWIYNTWKPQWDDMYPLSEALDDTDGYFLSLIKYIPKI